MNAPAGPSAVEIAGLILTAITLVLSTVLSIVLFWLVNRRGMAYAIVFEQIALINTRDGHVVRIKLWNSGRVPIVENDHDDPITLSFGPSAEVVKADTVESSPPTIKARVKLSKNLGEVIIGNPDVNIRDKEIPKLNPGDSITLELQVYDYIGKVKVSSHITWIKRIIESPQDLRTHAEIT